jgi:hypothetical protein
MEVEVRRNLADRLSMFSQVVFELELVDIKVD